MPDEFIWNSFAQFFIMRIAPHMRSLLFPFPGLDFLRSVLAKFKRLSQLRPFHSAQGREEDCRS